MSETGGPVGGSGRPRTAQRTARQHTAEVSFASSSPVRRRMQAQRARDTAPELALRRLLHARGLRYRVDYAPLPGMRRRADVVFTRARVAVFVDGCFWHSCPEHGNRPRANPLWWEAKLTRTSVRDADFQQQLTAAGWAVVRAWEHEDPGAAAQKVAVAVQARAAARSRTASPS